MIWDHTHFPAAMRSLSPSVRAKAIEIANSLLEKGGANNKEIVSTSIYEARVWARQQSTESSGINFNQII